MSSAWVDLSYQYGTGYFLSGCLLDGRSLHGAELARTAGITYQTANLHLAKLTEGRLLEVISQGRHRYYRIANARVAKLLANTADHETDFRGRIRTLGNQRDCAGHPAYH